MSWTENIQPVMQLMLLLVMLPLCIQSLTMEQYQHQRNTIKNIREAQTYGAELHLSEKELKADRLSNFTYRADCHVCMNAREILAFAFSKQLPAKRDDCT